MRNTKLLALPMVLMLGLLTTGFAYAVWSETLYISGSVATGEVDWEFVYNNASQKDPCDPATLDWTCDDGFADIRQLDKNVGCTEITYHDMDGDGDYETLGLTLNNVYPCYFEHISFVARCTGTVPIRIQQVNFVVHGTIVATLNGALDENPHITLDLNRDDKADIEIKWMNSFGKQLHPFPDPRSDADISFNIHVFQDAPQGEPLPFTIEIVAVQWNEYEEP